MAPPRQHVWLCAQAQGILHRLARGRCCAEMHVKYARVGMDGQQTGDIYLEYTGTTCCTVVRRDGCRRHLSRVPRFWHHAQDLCTIDRPPCPALGAACPHRILFVSALCVRLEAGAWRFFDMRRRAHAPPFFAFSLEVPRPLLPFHCLKQTVAPSQNERCRSAPSLATALILLPTGADICPLGLLFSMCGGTGGD